MFQRSLLVAATALAACYIQAASGQANEPWYPCGGIFWGSGAISSPGYPSDYPNNANCTWILNANTTGFGIRLQFTTFQTETNYDVVRISDGKRQLSYNGTGLSIPPLMLDRRVVVTFISDSSTTYSGFIAVFTTVSNVTCGGNVTGSGYIESEYYPLNYPDSKACTWYLQASSYSSVIKLQFTSFSTEPSYDVVKIYDERNYTYSYSGDVLPPILILGRLARVEFLTDSSVSKQGFRATMTSVNTGNYSECTAIGNYWCHRSYKCISKKWLCDRQPDCLYGEDEASCPITITTTEIFGASIGSALGFVVIVTIISVACRLSKRNARTVHGTAVTQGPTVETPTAVCSVRGEPKTQFCEAYANQAQHAAPPTYEASVKAYTAGWTVSD